ncbi:MAG: hypothetical protein ACR5LG_04610 [Sodalis sp. (in: enterobacteria)]
MLCNTLAGRPCRVSNLTRMATGDIATFGAAAPCTRRLNMEIIL